MNSFNGIFGSNSTIIALAAVTALYATGLAGCATLKRSSTGEFTLSNATIEINGSPLTDEVVTLKTGGLSDGIVALTIGDHGTFLLSEKIFQGALPSAHVEGNRLEFSYYNQSAIIQSEEPIHPENADLWVGHDPDFRIASETDDPSGIHSKWIADYEQYRRYRQINMENSDSSDDIIVDASDVDQEPRLIGSLRELLERVEYPEEARRKGIEGIVYIQFIIEKDGSVSNPEVTRGIGGGCDRAALSAVRNVRFKPAMKQGYPVRMRYTIPFNFGLDKNEGEGFP